MATFTVWEHERFDEAQRHERAKVVRDGFSWAALLFGPLWLLAHGMWLVLLALVAALTAIVALAEALGAEGLTATLVLLTLVWFAFEASSLRRWSLARRGWRLMAVVDAKRAAAAERRYFASRLVADGTLAGTGGAVAYGNDEDWTAGEGVLGLFPERAR